MPNNMHYVSVAIKTNGMLLRFCAYRASRFSTLSEGKEDRARRRANKIRERLGGEPERAAPFPQKPPSMRQSTYERLRNKAFDDEMTANETQIERLLAWLNKSGNKREFW